MRLQVRFHGVQKSEAVAEYVERQVGFTLGRFFARIERVQVWFDDANGPARGSDKRCLIEVVGDFGTLVARAQSPDMVSAAKRALDVLERTIARAVRRRRMSDFSNHRDDISSFFAGAHPRRNDRNHEARARQTLRLRPPDAPVGTVALALGRLRGDDTK